MQMIMFVLDDPNKLEQVIARWDAVGFHGATVVESTGIHRIQAGKKRLPMRYGMGMVSQGQHVGHFTLFMIVQRSEDVQLLIKAAEEVVGDLDNPNTGVMASWPLDVVKGVPPFKASVE